MSQYDHNNQDENKPVENNAVDNTQNNGQDKTWNPEEFLVQELSETKKGLQNTQIYGSLFVFALMCFLFGISSGFASNLEPKEAAKIAKGLVVQRLDEAQPQLSEYLRREIPAFIESTPEMAKEQLPILREETEGLLEQELEKFAQSTSDQLDKALDAFLIENQDQFKTIILAGQDKETTDAVAREMREMFIAYLSTSESGEESIQQKLDQALASLHQIEAKTTRLANAKDLDAVELKTRRAIACLFQTIDENKGAWNLPTKEAVQKTVGDYVDAANAALPTQ